MLCESNGSFYIVLKLEKSSKEAFIVLALEKIAAASGNRYRWSSQHGSIAGGVEFLSHLAQNRKNKLPLLRRVFVIAGLTVLNIRKDRSSPKQPLKKVYFTPPMHFTRDRQYVDRLCKGNVRMEMPVRKPREARQPRVGESRLQ